MSWLALLLIGVSVSDLGFSAWRRPRLGSALAGVVVIAVGLLAGLTDVGQLLVLLVLLVVVAGWGEAVTAGFRTGRVELPLVLLGVGVTGCLALAGAAPSVAGPLARWLDDVPWTSGLDPDRVLLVAGLALLQLSTGNVIVRLVLAASGTTNPLRTGGDEASEPALKGGRLLGPMERLLILGLGLAGQATAASIVIAAKGLLRFPELQAARADGTPGPGIHEVTEYFLVGSFVSWLVALGSLALLAV